MSNPAVAFYVGAHQDDWQLFRGNWAWDDAASGSRVVFIYLTAGDAGDGEDWWKAREAAAMASIEAMTGSIGGIHAYESINEHTVTFYDVATTRSYFLRLPDGGYDPPGEGYERTGHQSLFLLRTKNRPMSAIDGSGMYRSWRELVETVAAIVSLEIKDFSSDQIRMSTSDHDQAFNPNDHSDHYEVGEIVEELAAGKYQIVRLVGYDYEKRSNLVGSGALEKKRRLMRAYREKMRENISVFDEFECEKHDEYYMRREGERSD